MLSHWFNYVLSCVMEECYSRYAATFLFHNRYDWYWLPLLLCLLLSTLFRCFWRFYFHYLKWLLSWICGLGFLGFCAWLGLWQFFFTCRVWLSDDWLLMSLCGSLNGLWRCRWSFSRLLWFVTCILRLAWQSLRVLGTLRLQSEWGIAAAHS